MPEREDIRFFCGINEKKWNGVEIECGDFACVAPVYGASDKTRKINSVTVPNGVQVLQDSGAFSYSNDARPSFEEALEKQIQHAELYQYVVTYRASFDLLADEVWIDGVRYKTRHSPEAAQVIIDTTVAAAQYLSRNRCGIPHLLLSVQGVTPVQYAECAQKVLEFVDPSVDSVGLGGWCIIGKRPKQMMPVFQESLDRSLPLIAEHGVKHIHIFGVVYPVALAALLRKADEYGLQVSTDSAGPSYRPAFGCWGYGRVKDGGWSDKHYKQPPLDIRGSERVRHVKYTIDWLKHFRDTEYYQNA